MYELKTNCELRAEARDALNGNWWISLAACFLVSAMISAASGISGIGGLIIGGPLELGLIVFFINQNRTRTSDFNSIFSGFEVFGKSLGVYLLRGLFVFLWSLLFIIPGIIAQYKYSQAIYILADKPDIDASEALEMSKKIMEGNKWKLFCLHLSFIGWAILCLFTFGIGYLFLIPYIRAAETAFYEDLLRNNSQAEYVA